MRRAKEAVNQSSRPSEEVSSVVRCTKGVVSSKPVLVQQNIAVVSKPTNVEVGPAKVEKEKFNKRRLPGNKVDTWDNLMQLV